MRRAELYTVKNFPKPADRYAILAAKLRSIRYSVADDDFELLDKLHALLRAREIK